MSHLGEGTLLAIRDGCPVDADALLHVEQCASCRAALGDVRARARTVADALESLVQDVPVDVEAAKVEVRRRLDGRREASRRRVPGLVGALGRAAVLLLLAAGVAYALPGSPLRAWLEDRVTPTVTTTPSADDRPPTTEGVELDVPLGGLRVVLTSVEQDQRLEVTWSDGERVRLVAAPGSRYAIASGRVEAEVAAGPVRVVLPKSSGSVTIEAERRMVLRSVDGEIEILGEVVFRDADRIVVSMSGG